MSFLIGALKVIFLLGFLIIIHEGGHFCVAKLCKVYVKEFSIGFGPKLLSKQGKETKYTLRAIPFGGYVDMLGETERSSENGSFSQAKVWKRIAIVVAGATVNIVFGICVYFILVSANGNFSSLTIREIASTYEENLPNLKSGDTILYINNKRVRLKSDVDNIVSSSEGKDLKLLVKRDGEKVEINVKPSEMITKSIDTYFNASADTSKVKYMPENSTALKSGIQVNDIITKVNDKEIENYVDIFRTLNEIDTDKVDIEVLRDGENKVFEVELSNYTSYILGVYFERADNTLLNRIYYGFWNTTDFMGEMLRNVKNIFRGNVSMDQMTGPIGISEMVVETNGVYNFVYLMSLISLSLGVTNLLPIPALDGGKIVLLIIEAIRRKPLSEEIEINIQMIGFTLLILFSLYISYKDILRIF